MYARRFYACKIDFTAFLSSYLSNCFSASERTEYSRDGYHSEFGLFLSAWWSQADLSSSG